MTAVQHFVHPVRDSIPHGADELSTLGSSSAACPIFIRSVPDSHALSAPCGVFIPHGADEPPENGISSAPCPRTQRTKHENLARNHRESRTGRGKETIENPAQGVGKLTYISCVTKITTWGFIGARSKNVC